MRLRTGLLLGALASACGSGDPSPAVVLLGDASRLQAASLLEEDFVNVVVPESSHVLDVADMAHESDYAVIVNDSTVGPTPIVREHILLARQLQIPTIALLLSRTDELVTTVGADAMELLELEELELRELMNQYELPGDTAAHFYDSDAIDPTAGPSALLRSVGSAPRRGPATASAETGSVLDSEIYSLSRPESSEVRTISSGDSVSLWLDGQRLTGSAELDQPIQPSDVARLAIRLGRPISVGGARRFFIERNGTIVAVGVVVSVRD